MPDSTPQIESLKSLCHRLRDELKGVEVQMRCLNGHPDLDSEQAYGGQHDETRAQIMLVVRHIEDARMRIGKVLQYADDGVSILDKPPYKG